MWNHWTVRSCTPHQPFLDFEVARWTWTALHHRFPAAVSAVLMPNHLHLILPSEGSQKALRTLSGILGGVSKKQGISHLWQPIPPPSPVPDVHHLRRQIRYVALNPCRKRLCRDPLEWVWSSYRDLMGAAADNWIDLGRTSSALSDRRSDFRVRFHNYVSGDPAVQVSGTPIPRAAESTPFAAQSILDILSASAAALRLHPRDVERRTKLRPLFIHLAARQGWNRPAVLGEICDLTPRAVQYILNASAPAGLDAAALCLGDPRLRHAFDVLNFAKHETQAQP